MTNAFPALDTLDTLEALEAQDRGGAGLRPQPARGARSGPGRKMPPWVPHKHQDPTAVFGEVLVLYRGAGAKGYKPNTRPLRRRRNEPAVLQLAVSLIHYATDGQRSTPWCPEHALSRCSAG
jgi:hypothetical protein